MPCVIRCFGLVFCLVSLVASSPAWADVGEVRLQLEAAGRYPFGAYVDGGVDVGLNDYLSFFGTVGGEWVAPQSGHLISSGGLRFRFELPVAVPELDLFGGVFSDLQTIAPRVGTRLAAQFYLNFRLSLSPYLAVEWRGATASNWVGSLGLRLAFWVND